MATAMSRARARGNQTSPQITGVRTRIGRLCQPTAFHHLHGEFRHPAGPIFSGLWTGSRNAWSSQATQDDISSKYCAAPRQLSFIWSWRHHVVCFLIQFSPLGFAMDHFYYKPTVAEALHLSVQYLITDVKFRFG